MPTFYRHQLCLLLIMSIPMPLEPRLKSPQFPPIESPLCPLCYDGCMTPDDIHVGQLYWIQIGCEKAMYLRVVTLPGAARLWTCEDASGKRVHCATSDFVG